MRKRINLSVSDDTYNTLHELCRMYSFSSVCEMVSAMINIWMDRLKPKEEQEIDTPEDVSQEIDMMFNEFSYYEKQPSSDEVPVHGNTRLYRYGK